jgi:transcriptional regulator with XRE-family HTH domain
MEMEQMKLLVTARQRARDGSARHIRRRAGLTLAQMADAVGVTESTMSRWENGQRQPRSDALLRWAGILAELELATATAAAR